MNYRYWYGYENLWASAESSGPPPSLFNGKVIDLPFEVARDRILSGARHDLMAEFYRGSVVILRGAFSREFIETLKRRTIEFTRSRKPGFFKMLEGSPDFHRMITPEEGLKYAFPCCKHSAYFYRWNVDPLNIIPVIYDRWRVAKVLMGYDATRYEENTPKDGVVDRIQIVRYPPGIGFLAKHADPHLHQRLFISTYMSKRGVDYHGGGFYLQTESGPVYLEDQLEVGDMCLGYATVQHGVTACDGEPDWSGADGRWFLSLYSNASDEVANRHTGRAVE